MYVKPKYHMHIEKIDFATILPIWKDKLWPMRISPIETHSAMTWPFDNPDSPYDMNIFNYPATYIAAKDQGHIVGVMSVHPSSDIHCRIRGVWVQEDHRLQGICTEMLGVIDEVAALEGCKMIWGIPRMAALPVYLKYGYIQCGDVFVTETSPANTYMYKMI